MLSGEEGAFFYKSTALEMVSCVSNGLRASSSDGDACAEGMWRTNNCDLTSPWKLFSTVPATCERGQLRAVVSLCERGPDPQEWAWQVVQENVPFSRCPSNPRCPALQFPCWLWDYLELHNQQPQLKAAGKLKTPSHLPVLFM